MAVTRSLPRGDELANEGIGRTIADVTVSDSLAELHTLVNVAGREFDTVLFAVGVDRGAGVDMLRVHAGGLQNVLAALMPSASRLIYVSTTGVYGSAGGGWVDEQTPPDPQREGGRASLAAEQILAEHPIGRRSVILRMGGLYGPGRVPYLDRLRAGEPLPIPAEGWLNLIHVDDAARIVVAADQWVAARGADDGPHLFCVTDGVPVQRGEYYGEAARQFEAPPPRYAAPPPDSPAAVRAGANRRVSNEKMRRTFGLTLAYPTYREGLSAILGAIP
jgi:nucleoside-diphosphate-sugar epimerase